MRWIFSSTSSYDLPAEERPVALQGSWNPIHKAAYGVDYRGRIIDHMGALYCSMAVR
jgi:hypothetical protein